MSRVLRCTEERPDAQVKIFVFPHAGGHANAYPTFVRGFDPSLEVHVANYPGHGERHDEDLPNSVTAFAEDALEALVPELDRPFVLAGHSFGALVAFEVSLMLKRKNLPKPLLLCLSSCMAPLTGESSPTPRRLANLADGEFLHEATSRGWANLLTKLKGTDAFMYKRGVKILRHDVAAYESYVFDNRTASTKDCIDADIPVLLLGGDRDRSVPLTQLRRWISFIGRGEIDDDASFNAVFVSVIAGAGHFHVTTHATEAARVVSGRVLDLLRNRAPSIVRGPRWSTVERPEREQNKPKASHHSRSCLGDVIWKTASKHLSDVVLIDERRRMTFRDVVDEAEAIARILRTRCDVGWGRDGIVAVFMPTSSEWVVATVAILFAGGAIQPFYNNYTKDLMESLGEECGLKAVITTSEFKKKLPASLQKASVCVVTDPGWFRGKTPDVVADVSKKTFYLPRDRSPSTSKPDRLAFCAMTSGSTGRPKTIGTTHEAVMRNFLLREDLMPRKSGAIDGCNVFFVWECLRGLVFNYKTVVIPDIVIIDPKRLAVFFEEHAITRAMFTPSQLKNILDYPNLDLAKRFGALRNLMLCGEVVPMILPDRFAKRVPRAVLWNNYSTWESLDVSYARLPLRGPQKRLTASRFAPAGQLAPGVDAYILDSETKRPVPFGVPGDLYVTSKHMSVGYITDVAKTAARFVHNPANMSDDGNERRFYFTGDKARVLDDGSLEVMGRKDDTIKIRGFKVPLPLVEATVRSVPGVRSVVVVPVLNEQTMQPRALAAYVVGNNVDAQVIDRVVRSKIPEYAAPEYVIPVDSIPIRVGSGKVDKKRLPKPTTEFVVRRARKRPNRSRDAATKVDSSENSRLVPDMLAVWREVLGQEDLDAEDNFFDVGGQSLLASTLAGHLNARLGLDDVSVMDIYSNPTVVSLVRFVESKTKTNVVVEEDFQQQQKRRTTGGSDDIPIAVIGMAGKFPGADDVDTFWENLCQGRDSLRRFQREELLARGVPASAIDHPGFVRAGQVVDGADEFDAYFWGIGAAEAKNTDPQQRMFLQCAWHAMENAGYAPRSHKMREKTGVFAACGNDGYLVHHLDGGAPLKDPLEPGKIWTTEVGNEKDYIATRVAYQLDLGGPAFTVNSACSSGLVAVANAIRALQCGDCDVAIAGASSLTFPNTGFLHSDGFVNSEDGHVRPFDAEASGTLFGDSVGAVVLKPLSDAIRDGDHVWAVVRGAAVTNDGKMKAGFSAPRAEAQARAIRMSIERSGVSPSDISYVECHATATKIGDAIEIRGLKEGLYGGRSSSRTDSLATCSKKERPVALGSVKGNIGHANCAAGLTGFMKTVLCLCHRTLVPTVHFRKLNPKIDFSDTPFRVQSKTETWTLSPGVSKRVAGVSSFGVGGTNVHVILEEAPSLQRLTKTATGRTIDELEVIQLSAKTPSALRRACGDLANYLEKRGDDFRLSDAAQTLRVGREHLRYRVAVTASSAHEACDALRARARSLRSDMLGTTSKKKNVVFVFPGQGTQWLGMGRSMYAWSSTFRGAFDACCDVVDPLIGTSLREATFGSDIGENSDAAIELLQSPSVLQPALFSVEYSMGRELIDRGVSPQALCGHSIGEYVAAALSGVFTLKDALRLIVTRGRATETRAPRGAMLSVTFRTKNAADRKRADGICDKILRLCPTLALAASNAPGYFVFSGLPDDVSSAAVTVSKQYADARVKPLRVNRAFHSTHMKGAAVVCEKSLESVSMRPPRVAMSSNVSGDLAGEEVCQPKYWRQHMEGTVEFAKNVTKLSRAFDPQAVVEVGPGSALVKLWQKCAVALSPTAPSPLFVPSMIGGGQAASGEKNSGPRTLLVALSRLWERGLLGAEALASDPGSDAASSPPLRRVPLPGYSFEPTSFWVRPARSIYAPLPSQASLLLTTNARDEREAASVKLPQSEYLVRFVAKKRATKPLALVLYCFPFAGGSSRTFAKWSTAAPDDVDVVAVELPGKGLLSDRKVLLTKESDVQVLREIADAIAEDVDSRSRSKANVVLVGLSMGALFAVRVARLLPWQPTASLPNDERSL
eukprot:g987.t1